jgi:GNAT superfamily N-acetyltransferase
VRQSIEPPLSDQVLWQIEFFEQSGGRVLDSPLARKVFGSRSLYGERNRIGAVAYNAAFYLRPESRRRGFGRTLYVSEENLYRRWGIREIQMRAMEDGPATWIKHFGFVPREPALLAQQYRDWAQRRGLPVDPPAQSADYPDPFLSSCNGLILYKVLG